MGILPQLKSEVLFTRDVVKAGIDAASSVAKTPPGESLTRIVQSSLAPAALGAGAAILGVCLGRKGRAGSAAVLGGLVGCALGFAGGVAWGTRARTRAAARHAIHNVQAVRDAHWLEKHPVAYA